MKVRCVAEIWERLATLSRGGACQVHDANKELLPKLQEQGEQPYAALIVLCLLVPIDRALGQDTAFPLTQVIFL